MTVPIEAWVDKYRPTKPSEYIFQSDSHQTKIEEYIKRGSFPNLMLQGVRGSGKTSLARLLIAACHVDPADVLEVHASDDNGVDAMREMIKSFILTFAVGDFKVVLFEEADQMTKAAQAILRKFTEDYSDNVRFIFTCNYAHKISDPIHSRCTTFKFAACDKDTAAAMVAKILKAEKIAYADDILYEYVDKYHPDIRKVINEVQAASLSGKLESLAVAAATESSFDYEVQLIDLIKRDQWQKIRKLLCENIDRDEWDNVYRFIYENLHTSNKFSDKAAWEEGITIIAEYLYRDGFVSDREINAAAMLIQLRQVQL